MIGKDYLLQSLDDIYPFKGQILNDSHASVLILFKQVAKVYGLNSLDVTKITKDTRVKDDLLSQTEYTGWLKSEVEAHNIKWSDKWAQFEKELDFCYKYGGNGDDDGIIWGQAKHASGVILYPEQDQYVLPRAKGEIPYCGHALESQGFIKYDCLSVESLDSIAHFIPYIEKKTGKPFNWDDTTDPKVWEVFKRADTDLVFQFSSPGMKRILRAKKPDTIEKLAELNALYRPAAIQSGILERYLNDDYTDEEKVIGKFLKKEFGEDHAISMIYQEDIIRIVQGMTKFSATEADNIRRCVTKKKFKELNTYKDQFLRDFKRDEFGDIAQYVWDAIEEFCSYTFNKSHAVSYSMTAYWQAYIYTYWPSEYMSFFLNTGKNTPQALACLIEHGLKTKFPNWGHNDTEFYVKDNTICLPVKSKMKDVEENTSQSSMFNLAETNVTTEKFASQIMFQSSTEVNANIMKSGILDTFCKDRKALRDLCKELSKKSVVKNIGQDTINQIKTNDFECFLRQLKDNYLIKDLQEEIYTDGKIYHFKLINAKSTKDFTVNDTLLYNQVTNATEDVRAFGLVRSTYVSECPKPNDGVVNACNDNLFDQLQVVSDNITNAQEIANPTTLIQNEQKKLLTNVVNKYYQTVRSGFGLRVWGVCQDQVKACVKEVSIASNKTPKATLVFSDKEVEVTLNKYLKDDFKKMDKYTVIVCELDHIYTLDIPSRSVTTTYRVSRLIPQASTEVETTQVEQPIKPTLDNIADNPAQKKAENDTMEALRELFQETQESNENEQVVSSDTQSTQPTQDVVSEQPAPQNNVEQPQVVPVQTVSQDMLSIEEQCMMAELGCVGNPVVENPVPVNNVGKQPCPHVQEVTTNENFAQDVLKTGNVVSNTSANTTTCPDDAPKVSGKPADIFKNCVIIDYSTYSKKYTMAEVKYLKHLMEQNGIL